jgi:uncharacterized protein (TIGR03118 family)
VQTNLVSDIPGMAANPDSHLMNPWGMAFGPGGPFWVANNGTGTATLFNGQGQPFPTDSPLVVNIPINPNDQPAPPNGSPTGIVFNTSKTGFSVTEGNKTGSSVFLFDTQDGTISGWNPGVDLTNAKVGVKNPGADYTGLAIGTDSHGDTLLYAADFSKGTIDVYNQNFTPVTTLAGNFSDPNIPATYKPFNIQNINGKLYVEYANVDPVTHKTNTLPGNGIVDVFTTDGTAGLSTGPRLINAGPSSPLDAPWGVALAPADFGAFANDLLVGNFGDGHINAFDPTTGSFVGQLMISSGQAFEEDHLWALEFGLGGNGGSPNTLFFNAGINNQHDGLFGSLQAVPVAPPNTPIIPNLSNFPQQTIPTVPANGDQNPYGLAFVPQNYQGGGLLAPGDILVANFNNKANLQGTGSTIVRVTPDGQQTVFFQGEPGLGLTTALGVLPQGFVIVGSVPTTDGTANTIKPGALLILDSFGNEVAKIADPTLVDGPWDLTINNQSATSAQVFVSNVLSGKVTRLDLSIPTDGSAPQVSKRTQIASGFVHRSDPAALVVGPTGLAFDPKTGTLYVAATGNNAIYAIPNAASTSIDNHKGKAVIQDPQHLHGPIGLLLAPNGDLIVSNGDAVNIDTRHPSELTEYTPAGQFVGQFSLDPKLDAPFGVAVQVVGAQTRFAAVNDNNNTVEVWTFLTSAPQSTPGTSLPTPQVATAAISPSGTPSNSGGTASNFITALDQLFMSFEAMIQQFLNNEATLMQTLLADLAKMMGTSV